MMLMLLSCCCYCCCCCCCLRPRCPPLGENPQPSGVTTFRNVTVKGLSRRELRFVQAMRREKVPNVIMIEALWDMTEDTIGVHYGQYADMRQAAVVVGTTVGEGLGG
jgi:hypothetical protein